MRVIQLEGDVSTTDGCRNLLNAHVSKKNWKRLYKIGDNIRCFTNEDKDFVTIADGIGVAEDEAESEYDEGEVSPCAFVGVNIQNEIKAIRNIAKFYYTMDDYGNVYYNPYKKSLFIVGSDGGYGYSKTKPKLDIYGEVEEEAWDTIPGPGDSGYKEFNEHPETAFITNVDWEAESDPEGVGYMLVGKINC